MVKSSTRRRRARFLALGEFAALGATAVILLVFLASSLDGLLVRNGLGAAVITADLIGLTNTDRADNSLPALSTNPTLTEIAQAKANDMAQNGYFAHTSPAGKDPWYWFKQGGYAFSYAGENLAVDFSDSADVERAWMNSPTHRANILNNHYTQIGIATAVGMYQGQEVTFVVQEFATPAASASVANAAPSAVPNEPTVITSNTTPVNPTVLAEATAKPVASAPSAVQKAPAKAPVPTETATSAPVQILGTTAGTPTSLATPASSNSLLAIWDVFAASPKTTLRYAYYLFGILILIAFVIETGIELKHHHLRHVALAVGLIALMSGLFLTADRFVFTNPVLGEGGAQAPLAAV